MANRTNVNTNATGTALDILTDERTVANLSDGVAAKLQYVGIADGTPDGQNLAVVDNTGALKVAVGSSALPTGAATEASMGTDINAPTAMPAGGAGVRGWLSAIWTKLNGTLSVSGTFWQATQPVSAASLPLPSGAATEATLDARTGSLTEAAPATDIASSGLNGRLQRIAQRLSSMIGLLPAALGAGGGLKVDGSGTALPVSAASLPLPTGAATSAGQFAKGTAGSPSTEVASVQGVTNGTPVIVVPATQVLGTVEITRPADAIAYIAGDSVNTSTTVPTIMDFGAVARANGGVAELVKVRAVTDSATCTAGLRLWLFKVAAPTLTNDNAAFNLAYADKDNVIGYVDMPAFAQLELGGNCAVSEVDGMSLSCIAAVADTHFYGVWMTRTGWTPVSGQKIKVYLTFQPK